MSRVERYRHTNVCPEFVTVDVKRLHDVSLLFDIRLRIYMLGHTREIGTLDDNQIRRYNTIS